MDRAIRAEADQPAAPSRRRLPLPLLVVLFAVSGAAALIYEVVWFQLLELIIGSSAISLGILLAAFMGGMCLGAEVLPRVVGRRTHPWKLYAALELGIGVFGLAIVRWLPTLGDQYSAIAPTGSAGLALRALCCIVALLPPTMLMGATLPAVARWLKATPDGAASLGLLYTGNIVGGVVGALTSAFYLLRLYDVMAATSVAVALNLTVAAVAYLSARGIAPPPAPPPSEAVEGVPLPGAWRVALVVALSGVTALGAQVVWTRLLSLMLGATVYTFAIILAVVLIGLGLGSAVASAMIRRGVHAWRALGWSQLLLPFGMAWAGYLITRSLPYWPVNPALRKAVWLDFGFDLLRSAMVILPPTILWGAAFPFAMAAATRPGKDPGKIAGRIYAANTAGAIVGALVFSLIVIPHLGTHGAQRAMMVVAVIAGLIMLAPFPVRASRPTPRHSPWVPVVVAALALPAAFLIHPVSPGFIGYGRHLASRYAPPLATLVRPGGLPWTLAVVASVTIVSAVAAALLRRRPACAPLPAGQRSWMLGVTMATVASGIVLWSHVLLVLLGSTPSVLTALGLLIGAAVALGSVFGGWSPGTQDEFWARAGWLHLANALAAAFAGLFLTGAVARWPIAPALSLSVSIHLQLFLLPALLTIPPLGFLWGAALRHTVLGSLRPIADARFPWPVLLGGVAAATAAATGSAMLMPLERGTQWVAWAIVGTLLMMSAAAFWQARPTPRPASVGRTVLGVSGSLLAGLAILATLAGRPVGGAILHGDAFATGYGGMPDFVFAGEGVTSSIAVSRDRNGDRSFFVSGKIEASSTPRDMRLQRLLGHMAAAVHGSPKSVLVVGFGAGVTAGSFLAYPGIERIVICELEPMIPGSVGPYFSKENNDVLNDPRVTIVYDDARHFIRTLREKFDIITSDPIHPWVRGAASLYTEEYFAYVRGHLRPGGVATQWIPLYESHSEAVKSQLATFFSVFPEGTLWANNDQERGYDLVVLGQPDHRPINVDRLQGVFDDPAMVRVAASLREVGFHSLIDLFGTYAGSAPEMAPWLRDAAINRDRNLRLQYLAGLSNNSHEPARIYQEIIASRTYPERLFEAGPAWKDALSTYMQLRR